VNEASKTRDQATESAITATGTERIPPSSSKFRKYAVSSARAIELNAVIFGLMSNLEERNLRAAKQTRKHGKEDIVIKKI